ncbi:MAG: type IX secretion system sortase PorU [Marinifilaceae bacterium]|jgi:hypothetical protein|nr:type IX secretion system sortase PorU [Marinifilaceae bacterium]
MYSNILFSQNNFKLKWKLDEIKLSKSESRKIICFENNCDYNYADNLPVFSYSFEVTGTNYTNIRIENDIFEKLNQEELNSINVSKIESQFNIKVKSYHSRNKKYLLVSFCPIRKSTSSDYSKLIDFNLRLLSESNSTKNRKKRMKTYKSYSILSSGNWKKIAVTKSGIHKISYEQLIQFGITNPKNIRIYGHGGGMLSVYNKDEDKDDLPLNIMYMNKGDDNIFNEGDYILFYANGPTNWTYNKEEKIYEHQKNIYSDSAFYFISSDLGEYNFPNSDINFPESNQEINFYDNNQYYEEDKYNLLNSGSLWLGQKMDIEQSSSFGFNFPGILQNSLYVKVRSVARSSGNPSLNINYNSQEIGKLQFNPVNLSSYTSRYANLQYGKYEIAGSYNEQVNIGMYAEKDFPSDIIWLDYISAHAKCALNLKGEQLSFQSSESIGYIGTVKYNITNTKTSDIIWEIGDSENQRLVKSNFSNSITSFTDLPNKLKKYVVFNPLSKDFPEVFLSSEVKNQNLHASPVVDLIIVSNRRYLNQANALANLHRSKDNLSSIVVDVNQIYNEFSSGSPDISSIRNFVRMLYTRGQQQGKLPKYLLLFGDASYDNKNITGKSTNDIPCYQSFESLSPVESFVSDDFFVFMDEDEGGHQGLVDIGVGRLAVNSESEATDIVNKIQKYYNSESGSWQNKILFIADDEDGNIHMRDANLLIEYVQNNNPSINTKSLFLDSYQQLSSAYGQSYPQAKSDITDNINNGCLIVNYTGHGNEYGLSHESVINIPSINSWTNKNKLTVFVTATCEFSRFDNHELKSAGEILMCNPDGGAVGMLTTTRLVYSTPNFDLNKNFYIALCDLSKSEDDIRIGDLMRITKVNSNTGINKRNFTLLGDPALKILLPKPNILTTKINNVELASFSDSFMAMSEQHIQGVVTDSKNNKLQDFNGYIYPVVYDKKRQLETKGNDGDPFEYESRDAVIFRGKSKVEKGEFEYSFFVPKDISYKEGDGKIIYYADRTENQRIGNTQGLKVGGSNPNPIIDNNGPVVQLYMNNYDFVDGGLTGSSPTLIAKLEDETGINTIGNSIGHDIILKIDNKEEIKLNDYYISDLNNYKKGEIRYQMKSLESGEHTLSLKIWDNMNNSSQEELSFKVENDEKLIIRNLVNYPNPFTTNTKFIFEHNKAGSNLDVLIQVYTVSGKIVKTISGQIQSQGNIAQTIEWDGKDEYGDQLARGVYFYRCKVRDSQGNTVSKMQKMYHL